MVDETLMLKAWKWNGEGGRGVVFMKHRVLNFKHNLPEPLNSFWLVANVVFIVGFRKQDRN